MGQSVGAMRVCLAAAAAVLVVMVLVPAMGAPQPLKGEELQHWQALKKRLLAEGGYISGMDLMRDAVSGLGYYVTEPLTKNSAVLAIPPSFWMRPQTVLEHYPEWESLALPPASLLGLYLAVEKYHLPEDSFWNRVMGKETQRMGSYSKMLGRCFNGLYLTPREIETVQALMGGRIGPELTEAGLRKLYKKHLVQSDFVKLSYPVTFAQFREGCCHVLARSWRGHLMAPVLDFFNHAAKDYNAGFSLRDPTGKMHMQKLFVQVHGDLQPGQEVLINYNGQGVGKNMYDQLMGYGFVESVPETAFVAVNLPPSVDSFRRMLIQRMVLQGKPWTPHNLAGAQIKLTHTGFSPASAAALRVLAEEKVDSYFITRVHGKPQDWYPSLNNEAHLLFILAQVALQQMHSIDRRVDKQAIARGTVPTAIQQVEEYLARRPPGGVTDLYKECFRLSYLLLGSVMQSMASLATHNQ